MSNRNCYKILSKFACVIRMTWTSISGGSCVGEGKKGEGSFLATGGCHVFTARKLLQPGLSTGILGPPSGVHGDAASSGVHRPLPMQLSNQSLPVKTH